MTSNPCETKNDGPEICAELVRIFGSKNVKPEWSVCAQAQDDMTGEQGEWIRYCPKLDFVVGPFNITKDTATSNRVFENLIRTHRDLIDTLRRIDEKMELELRKTMSRDEKEAIEMFEREGRSGILFNMVSNKNPRTFLAIEIEKKTKEKHILGGFVHASAMGKIGIVISSDVEKQYKRLVRIRAYVRFLVAVGKAGNPEKVSLIKNVLLLKRTPFLEALRGYHVQI